MKKMLAVVLWVLVAIFLIGNVALLVTGQGLSFTPYIVVLQVVALFMLGAAICTLDWTL